MKSPITLGFINQLNHNLETNNGFLQVIVGPRQVGKTTTILAYLERQYRNKYHYVSGDSVFNASQDWVVEQWQVAFQEQKILVIDEIQKCENWSEIIKTLWDQFKREKKTLTCILLGSSSLKIQKGLTESLTGRFQLIKAFHWNSKESKQGYGLSFEEYLCYGGYPGSYPLIKTKDWASFVKQSIVSTVIEKDILQFQNVKSPALFKQAFEILISYPAQEISYTKLLGQIQDKGNTDLIKYYISLYEGAFLIKALEKFSDNKIKVKSSSPKILPLAPCFYYLSILDPYDSTERGRAFELAVGAQLVRTEGDLYYWREGNSEVDFILKNGKKIYAIEVKSGRKKDKSGLLFFKEKYPRSKLILITPENYSSFEDDPMKFLENRGQNIL